MHDLSPASFIAWLGSELRLERLSDTTVLLLGIIVGLIAKNLTTLAMRTFGFVGGFASRLAVGWWEEYRREMPNMMDFSLAAFSQFDGRPVLLMDPLIGPRRLSEVYLNPRAALSVRMQTFSTTERRPWVSFRHEEPRGLPLRLAHWGRRKLRGLGADHLSASRKLQLKYRRVYGPIETLIGQHLSNEWAAQMAIGEPCHVFRFVVALVYEKSAARHVDRHFHTLVIWEEVLRHGDFDRAANYSPDCDHRADTIRRIGEYYRSSPTAAAEFGFLHLMVPKRSLLRDYQVDWVESPHGTVVPISRPHHPDADDLAMHLLAHPPVRPAPVTPSG